MDISFHLEILYEGGKPGCTQGILMSEPCGINICDVGLESRTAGWKTSTLPEALYLQFWHLDFVYLPS